MANVVFARGKFKYSSFC